MDGFSLPGSASPGTPGALCVTRQTDVCKLGAKLGIDSMDLLGKVMPTKAVISGLARELNSDVRY
jgi:hypothetical protein